MRRADEISIKILDEGNDTTPPTSEIVNAGAPSGKKVTGSFLEAAVQWRDFYFLFLTNNTPFEEVLAMRLFDRDFALLDSAHLGGPYTTGSFSSLQLVEPDTLRFAFIGETTWTVQLFDRPHLRFPIFWDAPGVWRSPGFSRHFRVRGKPVPQPRS